MQLDNRINQETAEGIDIYLSPAGIGVRSLAFTIDLLIRLAILLVAGSILGLLGKFGSGLFLIIMFLNEWFYPVIFEVYKGATPGKSSFNLKVVYDNGLPITFQGSLIRNLFRSVDFLPIGYVFGAFSILLSQRKQRLGDIVAGTMVTYAEQDKRSAASPEITSNPITLQLSADEQAIIVAFTDRMGQFSKERQQEMANILSPVLGGKDDEALQKLQSLGASLIGKS